MHTHRFAAHKITLDGTPREMLLNHGRLIERNLFGKHRQEYE